MRPESRSSSYLVLQIQPFLMSFIYSSLNIRQGILFQIRIILFMLIFVSIENLIFWKLMCVAVGVVQPRGLVVDYLKAHLRLSSSNDSRTVQKNRREELNHARYCLRILHKCASVTRKYAPSFEEISSTSVLWSAIWQVESKSDKSRNHIPRRRDPNRWIWA
jgi:hypothetical protein